MRKGHTIVSKLKQETINEYKLIIRHKIAKQKVRLSHLTISIWSGLPLPRGASGYWVTYRRETADIYRWFGALSFYLTALILIHWELFQGRWPRVNSNGCFGVKNVGQLLKKSQNDVIYNFPVEGKVEVDCWNVFEVEHAPNLIKNIHNYVL